jgi:hypothetical protein
MSVAPGQPAPRAAEERQRLARALASLARAVTDLVSQVEARIDERCPYKTRDDGCTFAGGCENQRRGRGAAVVRCGGDRLLRRTPV